MKLEQFHYLLEINRLRSISAAARSLHIRQTTLSAMVKTVEEEVGFPIFQRAPTGVIATPAGEQFMSLAWEINVKYDELLSLKQRSIDGSQTISLLLAPSLLPVLSIPLTQRFHKFGVRETSPLPNASAEKSAPASSRAPPTSAWRTSPPRNSSSSSGKPRAATLLRGACWKPESSFWPGRATPSQAWKA